MKKFIFLCAMVLNTCSIPLTPVTPDNAGGSALVAGTTSTDYHSVCINAESKKVSVMNVSAQTGYPIVAVAISVCSQKFVLDCYKAGKCK